jgi:hypothetical protein
MHKHLTLILATFAISAGAAFGQHVAQGAYAIGYAANLNIGDSVVNLSNGGVQGGFIGATFGNGTTPAPTIGNICVNVYAFDPAEEEIACCACLVTPNGLDSLSAQADLISNPLTPAIPTSIIIKLVASEPAVDKTGAFTQCNPATVVRNFGGEPYYLGPTVPTGDPDKGFLALGMTAWGTTLEPDATPGTYSPVNVPFLYDPLGAPSASELSALTSVCNFIQSDGSGFGICKSCQTGALAGAKK